MAVNVDPLQITPYTSTVPQIQIPPEQMESGSRPAGPLPGQFTKSSGRLAIGDALLKGFIQGHQVKEQRKQAQAQATINAADAAAEGAYSKYQEALTQANGNQADPNAQAAYQSYLETFQKSKEAKAQFVIPEKPQKGQSSQQKKGEKGEKKTGWSSFKDFFEANPHIVPSIALLSMQPKPPGQSAQGRLQNLELKGQETQNQIGDLNLQETQRRQANEQTYQKGYAQFAGLTQDEIAALPKDVKGQYDAWVGAKAALTPMRQGGTMYTYKLPNGQLQKLYPEEAQTLGATLYAPSNDPKLGTVGDFIGTVASDNKVQPGQFTGGQKGYLEQLWHFYQQNPQASASTSWYLDGQGNWATRTAPGYRGPVPPTPPKGVFPASFVLPGAKGNESLKENEGRNVPRGALSRPPTQGATARPTGRMSAPPQGGLNSWQHTQEVSKIQTEQQNRYRKAEEEYTASLKDAQTKLSNGKIDQGGYQTLVKQAQDRLQSSKTAVQGWFDQQVKNLGGTPGDAGQGGGKMPLPPTQNAPAQTKAYSVSGYSQPLALSEQEADLLRKNGYTVEDVSALAAQ